MIVRHGVLRIHNRFLNCHGLASKRIEHPKVLVRFHFLLNLHCPTTIASKLKSIFFPHPSAIFHLNHKFALLSTNPYLRNRRFPVFLSHAYSFSSALYLFDGMSTRRKQNEDTDIKKVVDVIKTSTLRSELGDVGIAHCSALKIGAIAHLPISTALLTAYSRARDLESSRTLFSEIHNRDVIFCNAMMSALVENQCYCEAVEFFVRMFEEESGFDSTSLLVVVSALTCLNDIVWGYVIHGLSMKSGMLSHISLCNSIIDMYAKSSDLSSSEDLFREMACRDQITWNCIMSACLFNNNPGKTLQYLRERNSRLNIVDSISLSCAISAAACLGDLTRGQLIHGLVIKTGLDQSSYLSAANSLVSFYAQCGQIEDAEIIFQEMRHKDTVSWNAMFDGYASNGNIVEAFGLLRIMQVSSLVELDKVALLTAISTCADQMLLREGRAVHGFIVRRGMEMYTTVNNSLIDMYAKCKSIRKAEFLFHSNLEKDLVSWNSMISGYSKNELSEEAQTTFKELILQNSECSMTTVLAILPSCNSPRFLRFGESIHCWQLKFGFSNHNLTVNSLINMYITCGDLRTAFSLLGHSETMPDTICWNTVIAGCTKIGYFQEALETFNLMRQAPCINYDVITLVNVLSACGYLERIFEGKSIHGAALKTPIGSETRVKNTLITMYGRCGDIESARLVFSSCSIRNLCSWNCMISAFCSNNHPAEALQLFDDLAFEPDEITMVGLLSACSQLGMMRHVKQIHGHTFRLGFQFNTFISAALVDLYSSIGRLDLALQVFINSPKRSSAAWNSMIAACGFHSNGKKAIEVFQEMCQSETRPNSSTFFSLLAACSHSELITEGLWYYNNMLNDFGVEPATEHQVCVVDMLGRSGKHLEAYEFIKQLKNRPEPGVWGALLSSCNYHGNLELGREIAEVLFKLEPENTGYYISLSKMYVAAGGWKNAVELRDLAQAKRLRKPAGYSIIDVNLS